MKALLFIHFLLRLLAPECFVSHVEGTVTYAKNNKLVKIGDPMFSGEKLNFKSTHDFISLMAQDGETYPLGPAIKSKKSGKPGLWTYISNELVPSKGYVIMATRDGAAASLNQIKSYFNAVLSAETNPENDPYLIIGQQKLPLLKAAFEHRDKNFFYLRYHYQGKTINKKISYLEPGSADDNLYLLLDEAIFKIDGKPLNPDQKPATCKLMYYDALKMGSDSVRSIKIKWIAQQPLLSELRQIKSHIKPGELKQVLYNHIRSVYGVVDENKFNELIAQL